MFELQAKDLQPWSPRSRRSMERRRNWRRKVGCKADEHFFDLHNVHIAEANVLWSRCCPSRYGCVANHASWRWRVADLGSLIIRGSNCRHVCSGFQHSNHDHCHVHSSCAPRTEQVTKKPSPTLQPPQNHTTPASPVLPAAAPATSSCASCYLGTCNGTCSRIDPCRRTGPNTNTSLGPSKTQGWQCMEQASSICGHPVIRANSSRVQS